MQNSIFAMYEKLWLLTRQMLDAAQRDDWDTLIEVELMRDTLVEHIASYDGLSDMTEIERQKTSELIQRILVADEEIQALTVIWMDELQEMLGSIGTEKKLHKAYETP